MQNKIEIMLIGLEEHGLRKEKQEFLEALSIMSESATDICNAIKTKMIACVANDEYDKLQELSQLSILTKQFTAQIDGIKGATKYNKSESETELKQHLVAHKLYEDMANQTPYKLVLEEQEYILEKPTWRCMFEVVMKELAKKSPERFMDLVDIFNAENASYCKFSQNKGALKSRHYTAVYIEDIKMYMVYQGDSKVLTAKALRALHYFNLQDKCEVYVNGKLRNVSKKK